MKRDKKVEYKETTVFELFPEYSYTKRQRSRITLFHGYAANVVKMIRYASHFDRPNKICLVWIVGESKQSKIDKTLSECGCSDRVFVLTSPFPKEKLDLYWEFDQLRSSLKGTGRWDDKSQNVTQEYLSYHKRIGAAIRRHPSNEKDLSKWFARENAELDLIHKYHMLVKMSRNTYFKKYTCYRAGHEPKPFYFNKLDSVIEKIFPYGTEAMGINDFASLSPLSIDRALESYLSGEPNKHLGFTPDKETPAVRMIRKTINKGLADFGYCDLSELAEKMSLPPYGLGWNGYTAYCLFYALDKYKNRSLYLFDGVNTFQAKENLYGIFSVMFSPLRKKHTLGDFCCLYLEFHPQKLVKQAISKIFGVKITTPGYYMLMRLRSDLESKHRLPLSSVDKRLYHLVSLETPWYDREAMTLLANDVSNMLDELCDSYLRYKEKDALLVGSKRNLYPSAAPWLWGDDLIDN